MDGGGGGAASPDAFPSSRAVSEVFRSALTMTKGLSIFLDVSTAGLVLLVLAFLFSFRAAWESMARGEAQRCRLARLCSRTLHNLQLFNRSDDTLKTLICFFLDTEKSRQKRLLLDDGKLSFDEFRAYFADGILSREELHDLFHTIDTHHTEWVAFALNSLKHNATLTLKNCLTLIYFKRPGSFHLDLNCEFLFLLEYFSQHLGEYENVLSALEDLNVSILKAMDTTKENYQEASKLEQFVTRFLLKETLNQLQSLHNSLECAVETTEEQTRQEKGDFPPHLSPHNSSLSRTAPRQGPAKPEVLKIQQPGRRLSRRLQRNNSFSPSSPLFNSGNII
ncbi:N-terminal EF-hand calcium-binding protein 1 [Varanus komodoensis]|nr:N-terminal EF-hand calcium-binding protein 1 [Varanus komodoensis]